MTRPSDNQNAVRDFVRNEVSANVAHLVSTLAAGYGNVPFTTENSVTLGRVDHSAAAALRDLTEQAFELASPVPDYEEAAVQEGWEQYTDKFGVNCYRHADRATYAAADWQELCDAFDIEPYDREVYEFWIVSPYLADKLEAHGEKVDRDFAGLIVWARTTTGQATLLDGVICDIFDEMHNPKLEV